MNRSFSGGLLYSAILPLNSNRTLIAVTFFLSHEFTRHSPLPVVHNDIFTPRKYGSFSHLLHCLFLHLTLRNITCMLLMVLRFSLISIDGHAQSRESLLSALFKEELLWRFVLGPNGQRPR